MHTFAPDAPALLTIPLFDQNGQPITANAVSYRVTDQSGAEIVASTVLDIESGTDTVELVLPGSANQLSEGASRELRVVSLSVTTDSGSETVVYRYLIRDEDSLRVMKNSFQTFSEAMLLATELVNMDAWDAASDSQKQAALIDAYRAICKLNFNYAFENDQARIVDKVWAPYDLSSISEAHFKAMDARFQAACSRAQVIEANARLGGTDVSNLRRDGLMSATVGEVSQMFRPGKPLSLPVCTRALEALTGWITWSGRVSR